MSVVPSVGSSGTFVLKSPFDKSIISNRTYTCIAVRRLDEIIATGDDPYVKYYFQPYQLTLEEYKADLAVGVSICTLRAEGGSNVYVPSSFIESFPISGGVAYRNVGLLVNLKAISDRLDLAPLTKKISDLVASVIGVIPTITEASLSNPVNISIENHEKIEAARVLMVTDKETDYARAQRLLSENDTLRSKIQELEKYILSKGL